jgi:hypothetical protein
MKSSHAEHRLQRIGQLNMWVYDGDRELEHGYGHDHGAYERPAGGSDDSKTAVEDTLPSWADPPLFVRSRYYFLNASNMSRSFPTQFLPDSFGGPRAEQCPNREDTFQQLVGDALREEWGSNVFVAPTKGRDGGIDAYVMATGDAFASVHGVPPACSHRVQGSRRSASQSRLEHHCRLECRREKIARTGEQRLAGLYRPWRTARGYVYCVSAVLPNEQIRQEFAGRIDAFFRSLPAEQRPPIEKVQVIGWATIRDWLD